MKNRRQLNFKSLADAVRDIQRLNDTGYEALGSWSLPVMLDHLNLTMSGAFVQTMKPLPAPVRWILRKTVLPRMLAGKPLNLKAPAPRQLQPAEDVSFDDTFARFQDLSHRLESTEEPILNTNPAFGHFERRDWIQLSIWHAQHHLSFLLPQDA